MRDAARKRPVLIVGLIVVAVLAGAGFWFHWGWQGPLPSAVPAFDGDSHLLKATDVVATLDTPIRAGKNAVWCASFLSAWKTLETDLAKGPISLQGSPQLAASLNAAADPRAQIPPESLYVAAGWNQKGIIAQISDDLKRRFPAKARPTFPGIRPDSFVAYAYLEASLKFSIPYFQNRKPMVFSDSGGKKTELASFGVGEEDAYAYFKLRRQPKVLFKTADKRNISRAAECVLDLDCNSQPNQIVLALMEPRASLAATLAAVEERVASAKPVAHSGNLGPNDVLLVPDIVWRISHRFAELEGREFANTALKGQRMDVAQQDIQFCLNRGGAELKSEAKTFYRPIPTYYVFDRPFLLYMKKRGSDQPYFVMWVDNVELLGKWPT
jgi:hypothetical protein